MMGLKSLLSRRRRKKKGCSPSVTQSLPQSPTISRSCSLTSRAQIEEELKHVFKKFDVNGDGKISASELGSILGSLGNPATDAELEVMIREVDADGDGFIDLDEFIALNTKDVDYEEVLENLKEAFLVFDMDKNGSISAEELQNVMKSLGDDCSLKECEKMISGVDCDGDGMINFEEFKVMMIKGSRFEVNEARRFSLKVD